MNFMLDQVIYTRCMPRRELKQKGEVSRKDGFGVFSVSPAIVDGSLKIDYDHLQSRLVSPNAANEDSPVGLIHSYEYLELSPNVYALTYEYARPLCLIPRKKSNIAHRKGTYIKQSLVGQLKGYPCDFFGASCWDAHLKSENDYYLDDPPNAEPPWLCQVSDSARGGSVTLDRVRRFVADGRAEAVKAALWFLLQEFGKPISERRVLLIRDIPANVELWVAAIEHAFSPALARQITFSTNKTKLSNQTDTALFYYTDSAGRFYAIRNTQFSVTRRPYCMIVGFHPLDKLSENLRQLPNSNFVILDGDTKVLNLQTDARVHAPYFQAAVQYNEDMEDFCSVLLPSLPLREITPELPELFDAYKYLLDSNHSSDKWSYSDTLTHLDRLTHWGLPTNEDLNQYLLDECIRAYRRFQTQDELAGYALLQRLWKLASALQRQEEIRGCAAGGLTQNLKNLAARGTLLRSGWQKILDGGLLDMVRPALRDLFADRELPNYTRQFQACDAAVIRTVLDMYQTIIPNGFDGCLKNPDRFGLLTGALSRLIDDRQEAAALLRQFARNPDLFHALVLAVHERLARSAPARSTLWWQIVMDASGGNLSALCRRLADHPQTGLDLLEKLLTDSIVTAGRCTQDTEDAFYEVLRKRSPGPQTGKAFFQAWIRAAQPDEIPRIIAAARRANLASGVNQELFRTLDNCLPYELHKPTLLSCVRAMEDWSQMLGLSSKKIALAKLCRILEQRTLPASQVLNQVESFVRCKFQADEAFYRSDLFADIVTGANKYGDYRLTYLMLALFSFPDEKHHQYHVNAYVAQSLNGLWGPSQLQFMLYLTDLAITPPSMRGGPSSKRIPLQIYLENALRTQLPKYAKPGMDDRVARMDSYPPHIRSALISMLGTDTLNNNPLNDIFGGFFRKR